MRKFLIVASGIYITLLSILLMAVLLFPLTDKNSPLLQKGQMMQFFLVLSAGMGIWPLLTGIGIILKKNWARYSLFIICVFNLSVGLLVTIETIFSSIPHAKGGLVKIIILAVTSMLLIVIPLFFLIFFSRKSTKALFLTNSNSSAPFFRPVGITIVSVFTLVGAIVQSISIIYPFLPFLSLLGFVIRNGYAMRFYSLITALISFYIFINLLKMKKSGWLAFVVYESFTLINGIFSIFSTNEAMLQEMASKFSVGNTPLTMTVSSFRFQGAIGLVLPVILLCYMFSRKQLFFNLPTSGYRYGSKEV